MFHLTRILVSPLKTYLLPSWCCTKKERIANACGHGHSRVAHKGRMLTAKVCKKCAVRHSMSGLNLYCQGLAVGGETSFTDLGLPVWKTAPPVCEPALTAPFPLHSSFKWHLISCVQELSPPGATKLEEKGVRSSLCLGFNELMTLNSETHLARHTLTHSGIPSLGTAASRAASVCSHPTAPLNRLVSSLIENVLCG